MQSTPDHPNFLSVLDRIPLSSESPCSYFDDRSCRSRAFRFDGEIPSELFELLLAKGYRRCGDLYYQHNCRDCRLCINYRIDVADFVPTKSQQRVLRKNEDVSYQIAVPRPTSEKEEIYIRYQYEQHYLRSADIPRKSEEFIEDDHLRTMYYQMYTCPESTREIELFLDGRLIGFGILDVAVATVSAVYFVFDMAFSKRSLGTLAILCGIDWARAEGFRYYHMGYYIPGHPKMDYKKRFRNGQLLLRDDDEWSPVLTDLEAYVKRRLNEPDPAPCQ